MKSGKDDARYIFLDYLRALAAWLVAWDHLATVFPGWRERVYAPAEFVRQHFTGPLGIIQDFGWFGVAVFFLISGFIISDRARVESLPEFLLKRILRIYPMLIVTVLVALWLTPPEKPASLQDIFLNFTLANYLIHPQIVLVGVAWTLIIEVVFYAVTAATQFLRLSPHRIALNLAFVVAVVWNRAAFGASFHLFAVVCSYLPVLVMGQVVYWWLERKALNTFAGLAYLGAAYVTFVWATRLIQPNFLAVDNSYPISVAYAFLLFVVFLRVKLKPQWSVRLLSDTSYSFYLLHGLVGAVVIARTIGKMPLTISIALGAVASLLAAIVAQKLVEAPTQKLARRLSQPFRLKQKPPA